MKIPLSFLSLWRICNVPAETRYTAMDCVRFERNGREHIVMATDEAMLCVIEWHADPDEGTQSEEYSLPKDVARVILEENKKLQRYLSCELRSDGGGEIAVVCSGKSTHVPVPTCSKWPPVRDCLDRHRKLMDAEERYGSARLPVRVDSYLLNLLLRTMRRCGGYVGMAEETATARVRTASLNSDLPVLIDMDIELGNCCGTIVGALMPMANH